MINQEIKQRIIALLTSPNADERRQASETLTECNSVMVSSALAMALQDSDKGVRDSAARSLLFLKSKSVAYAIAEYLTDSSFITRNLASNLLLQFGDLAVEPLLEYSVHPNHDVRKLAIDTLGLIGDSKAVPTLISLLNDPDSNVILAAVEALGNIKDKSASAHLGITFVTYDFAHVVVAEALGKIGDESISPFLLSLLQERTNPEGEEMLVAFAVVEALAGVGGERSLEHIIPLIHKTNGKLQHILLYSLVCIAERYNVDLSLYSNFLPLFLDSLKDDDLRIVITSAKALLSMSNEEVEEQLLKILGKSEVLDQLILTQLHNTGHAFVKISQSYATMNIDQKKIVLEFILPILSEIVMSDDEEVQQCRSVLFSQLTEEWVDANEEMRGLIIDTLFYLDDEKAIEYFTALLDDTYQWLRMRVLELISQATHFRSNEVLAKFIYDENTTVREFVQSILSSRGLVAEEPTV
jgi:HEAT repeat protein